MEQSLRAPLRGRRRPAQSTMRLWSGFTDVEMTGVPELASRVGEKLVGTGDDAAVAEAIHALVDRLDAGVPPADAKATLEPALRLCQRLHGQAKSRYAVPLARAIHRAAQATGDTALTRWGLTTCGVLVLDTGDVVEAIQCFIEALRLAALEEDWPRMSGLWNNMGIAASGTGSHEMAVACYQRALSLVEKDHGPVVQRFKACTNLSNSYF